MKPIEGVITLKDFLEVEAVKLLNEEKVGVTVMKLEGDNIYCMIPTDDESQKQCSVKVGPFLVSDIPQYIEANNIPEFISYRNIVRTYFEALLQAKCVTEET